MVKRKNGSLSSVSRMTSSCFRNKNNVEMVFGLNTNLLVHWCGEGLQNDCNSNRYLPIIKFYREVHTHTMHLLKK